jgi:hypothetical protein
MHSIWGRMQVQAIQIYVILALACIPQPVSKLKFFVKILCVLKIGPYFENV